MTALGSTESIDFCMIEAACCSTVNSIIMMDLILMFMNIHQFEILHNLMKSLHHYDIMSVYKISDAS